MTISAEELAAVIAALRVATQSGEGETQPPSAWKLAARVESVIPFDAPKVTDRVR
jgi:hypothetical protein